MQSDMTTGPDLQLRRVAMGVTQAALAERIIDPKTGQKPSPNWVTRRESKARVPAQDASAYLAGLATFGTVPEITVKVAA